MTSYATRSPLHALSMPATQRQTRRTSARLAEKEDAAFLTSGKAAVAKQSEKHNLRSSTVNAGSKRKAATYDEEDSGFVFRRSKRSKAQAPSSTPLPSEPEPVPIVRIETVPERPKKTRGRRKASSPPAVEKEEDQEPTPKRRSARLSAHAKSEETRTKGRRRQATSKKRGQEEEEEEKEEEEKQPKRSAQGRSKKKPPNDHHANNHNGQQDDEMDMDIERAHEPTPEPSRQGLKITLPFADTPIIKRNKEMREGRNREKGQRRSSLGNRGRRASSLIDSGTSNALPHDQIRTSEFYKHIESGLPEPRRMKQLLIWCGTRALGKKPTGNYKDASERLAARTIQEELLKDFSNRSELSNWFDREEAPSAPVVKKPNPQNIQNLAKIGELEEQIARLRLERETLESILKNPSPMDPNPAPPDKSDSDAADSTRIDTSLLSESQRSLLSVLPSTSTSESTTSSTTSPAVVSNRLSTLTSSLEFTIDRFSSSVHTLSSYRDVADTMAGTVLEMSAKALDERDRAISAEAAEETVRSYGERERAGLSYRRLTSRISVRDVLRAISRVDDT